MIFYDPVDPNRNVASALSDDVFARFIYAARSYLHTSSELFFFPHHREPLGLEKIKDSIHDQGMYLLLASLDRPDLIDDNLYPQVRKTLEGMEALLTAYGFRVVDRSYHVGSRISMVVELEAGELPNAERHDGPPAWIDNASSFLKKWESKGLSQPFLDGGRWIVLITREYPRAVDLVQERLSTASTGSDLRSLSGLQVVGGGRIIEGRLQGAALVAS